MSYAPKPGSVAFRVIGWLEEQGDGKEFNSSQIAYALHLDTKGLPAQLAPALQAGLVFRRQKDSSSPRAPFWYSLTDHGAVHRREFRPSPKDWMLKPGSDEDVSAGPPASDGAASEGTAVTPGPSQPEAAPVTPQGDQPRSERGREVMEPEACESAAGRGSNAAPALAALPALSAAQQEAPPNPGSVEPAAPPAAPPLPPLVREEPREVDAHFAATIDAALADPEARFALWDDGHLICMVNGAIAWRCNPEQTERLRALLGGW